MRDHVAPIYRARDICIVGLSDRMKVTLFRCPTCQELFVTPGKATYCSGACRQRAYRLRRTAR
jgi:hypothetical protein